MKLQTLLIDDEPIALEKLRVYAAKVPFLEVVGECHDGLEAVEVLSNRPVHLIFTDISMPDLDGIEMVRSLPRAPLVVFTTAYDSYAVESYRLSAVDYLLKPYSFADFQRAALKAKAWHDALLASEGESASEEQTPEAPESIVVREAKPEEERREAEKFLFIKVDYKYVRVEVARIRYVKGYGEYLQIYVDGEGTPLLTLSNFQTLLSRLPDNFMQVHRSYIVNMEAVKQIERSRIVMAEDVYIPVSDSYKAAFASYLAERSVGGR